MPPKKAAAAASEDTGGGEDLSMEHFVKFYKKNCGQLQIPQAARLKAQFEEFNEN